MHVDCESQKLKSTDAADVFQAYSTLCSWGIGGHRSVNVRQTTNVSSCNFIHDNGNLRNTGPSTSHGGRNARGNPDVSLTTSEATCSRGIGGRRSNFIHENDVRNTSHRGRNTRANPEVGLTTTQATCLSSVTRRRLVRRRPSTRGHTVGSSFASGARTSYTYTNFGDSNQRCHHCGASFWTSRDKCMVLDILEFKIHLYNSQGAHGYGFPTSNTLGQWVFKVSGCYTGLKLKSANGRGRAKRITMLAYYRYQLHFRLQQYDLISKGGRLFQQYIVGERDGYEVRGRIILPMYFTGGPRYMYAHYLDALAVCRKLGNPHFSSHSHKIESFVAFLMEERIFRNVTGVLYTVEFQ
uniref:Helitron helicase-like domain-containing protein n=1 Tax=Tanacetum cinerariifolium TaxID=118510 RepID=A0A699JQ89_TANCI|nr:hypothetical protein [Tanacetum cinerariifolium]